MAEVNCNYVTNTFIDWPLRLTACPFNGMEDAQCPADQGVAGIECGNDPLPPLSIPCGCDARWSRVSRGAGALRYCGRVAAYQFHSHPFLVS